MHSALTYFKDSQDAKSAKKHSKNVTFYTVFDITFETFFEVHQNHW